MALNFIRYLIDQAHTLDEQAAATLNRTGRGRIGMSSGLELL